jgi:peptidyl-prolyl cis-trans isomerase C
MSKYRWMAACLLASAALQAGEAGDEVLARRGGAEITHQEFDARMMEIPEKDRATFLRDGSRLESLVANMLLREQLAVEARAAGYDEDPLIQAQLALAAQDRLAALWLEHYVDERDDADLEALAREYWVLHPQEFMSERTVDASHILVSKTIRSEEEAREKAAEILAAVRTAPDTFDALVMEYSDDPSKAENRGRFTDVGRGDMVKPFEDAAFSLAQGEISGLVESVYGYHIIRLDAEHKPRVKAFDEVRPAIVKQERQRHRDRVRNDYLNQLANQDVDMTEEALRKMLQRYFSPEALADWAEPETE